MNKQRHAWRRCAHGEWKWESHYDRRHQDQQIKVFLGKLGSFGNKLVGKGDHALTLPTERFDYQEEFEERQYCFDQFKDEAIFAAWAASPLSDSHKRVMPSGPTKKIGEILIGHTLKLVESVLVPNKTNYIGIIVDMLTCHGCTRQTPSFRAFLDPNHPDTFPLLERAQSTVSLAF